MTERQPLPVRRYCETFYVKFGGLAKDHVVTVGYYNDGRIGEIFIDGGKSGEQIEAIAHDAAILTSMLLQHGVQPQTIAHALIRDAAGEPQSIIAVVVDRLLLEMSR